MNKIHVTLDSNIAKNAFNTLNSIYKTFLSEQNDENYKSLNLAIDDANTTLYKPLNDKAMECIKTVNYDISQLTISGNLSIVLDFNYETLKLCQLIDKCFELTKNYLENKAKNI